MRWLRRGRTERAPRRPMTRRRFLRLAGTAGAGLVVLWAGGRYGLDRFRGSIGSRLPQLTDDPASWLRIMPDGRVQLMVNKVEMGQGIGTAAAQIVADALAVPFVDIDLVAGDTSQVPVDSFGTVGSMSVAMLYPALRQACATAQQVLRELAEERLGGSAERVDMRAGVVVAWRGGQATSFRYGELVQGRRLVRRSRGQVVLQEPGTFAVIGQDVPRLDVLGKVNGSARYGFDARSDGMVFGRVVRPPTMGAVVDFVDMEGARGLPGVVALVHEGAFVGVVAETRVQAAQALDAITVRWREREPLLQQADIDALLEGDEGPVTLVERGDVARVLASSGRRFSAQYRSGFAAHAQIEPQAAVADVRVDGAMVWTATQTPFSLRREIAGVVGLREEQVVVVPMLVGGGFGRKAQLEAPIEAARLSKAVGRPVRVEWSRAEEFAQDFMRPPTVTRFEAALDSQGQLVGWWQHLMSGYVIFGAFPSVLRLLFGSDFGATRGAVALYDVPHQWVGATTIALPVRTGTWRGLGIGPNAFAVEQFIDELALAAGVDAVAFRLRHLGSDADGQRMRQVIERVAARAGWGTTMPDGYGRGIACGYDGGTFVAEVAEVQVDRERGVVTVVRVVAVVDCGLAINPRNVMAQVEGGIMMGLSAALREEVVVRDGRWSVASFAEYPFFTLADAPLIEVEVVEQRGLAPGGVGEPPLMPAAAAVGNAVAAAVGARVRTMPMTPERVLAALQVAREERGAFR